MVQKITAKHYFCHILISQFSYLEDSLHFNLADFPVNFIKQFVSAFSWCLYQILLSKFLTYYCLRDIFYQEYCISYTEVLIFNADKLMVIDNLTNSRVFNFAILFKSRKFVAREIYMFYSIYLTFNCKALICNAILRRYAICVCMYTVMIISLSGVVVTAYLGIYS